MKFAVLFGGNSYEHEISIVSAITIKDKIKKHSLEFIFVDRDRELYLIDSKNMKSKYFSSLEYKKSKKLFFKKGGFESRGFLGGKELEFDVAINLIHGKDGEDGKIASLLSFYEIKAITPSVEASVISYNKLYTKMFAKEIGVSVIDYEVLRRDDKREINIDFPVIIKPVRLGSSIGISIANNRDEFEYGLDVAFEFDTEVLVEPFIEGIKEYNLAGCSSKNGELLFSRVEFVNKDKFLSYEDKYLDFSRKEIKEKVEDDKKFKEAFKKIYSIFGGALIRCDFFEKDGEVYLNEINPIPGSLANYLFDNFDEVLESVAKSVKLEKKVKIDYQYINKIEMAKGK